MAETKEELAQKILELKNQSNSSIRLRAEAEASLRQAEQSRDAINTRLKELGVDPENAEVELAAAEDQLKITVAELTTALNAEVEQYNSILKATRNIGG